MLSHLVLAAALALSFQSAPSAPHEHAAPQKKHQEPARVVLPEDGKPAHIPFELVANQVRIDATIRGKGPFHLALDTGMPIGGVLLFANERVQALDLAAQASPVLVAGAGGDGKPAAAQMASGLEVALGDLRIENTFALVVDPAPGFPPAIDGVVGGALFFHHVVRIDPDARSVEVRARDGWSPPEGATVVPLVRERGLVFLDLQVAVGGADPIPARVVVDIGASHALSLNAQDDGRFAPPAGAIEAPLGRGMSGVIDGQVGRVRRVVLGGFELGDVVASFPRGEHQRPGGGDFRDGNLGMEVLRRFVATFDYEGDRLVLARGKAYGEPFEREMAGLGFDWEPDGTVTVRSVLPSSPGAASDVRVGDRVLALNGKPIPALGETALRDALQVDGAEVTLTLRRGDETLERKLRLKRLV